jgi:alcohol dehydrogenase (cytochrome c)
VNAGQSRTGDNLYTNSIVALNPDTGKLVWHFQTTPHDTHDWDAVQTPVLIDEPGRKLLAQANRNGYFFVLDRTNGKNARTTPFIGSLNWSKGINAEGQPIRDPAKDPARDGVLVSPSTSGATNWPSPAFHPGLGLFFTSAIESRSVYYLTDTDDRPQGYGGRETGLALGAKASVKAVDYRTGKARWEHPWPGGGSATSMLVTAGNVLFTANGNYFMALNARSGQILWKAGMLNVLSNGPITYQLDGKQYVLAASGDVLYAFALN